MSPEEQIARGDHAKRLLDDPLLQEAMGQVRQAIIDSWASLGVENKAQAEELKRLLWAANQFKAVFESLVAGATIIRSELLLDVNMETKRDAALRRINGT
jgi:hypothetical protein